MVGAHQTEAEVVAAEAAVDQLLIELSATTEYSWALLGLS